MMKNLSEVDSCPFCGCAEIEIMKIYDTGGWYLRCGNCRVETPVYSTLQLAIKKWNRRVEYSKKEIAFGHSPAEEEGKDDEKPKEDEK